MSDNEWGDVVPESDRKPSTIVDLRKHVDKIQGTVDGVEVKEEIQPQPLISAEEMGKIARKNALNDQRRKVKKEFPKVKFEETREAMKAIQNNLKCLTCIDYYPQSTMPEVKAKHKDQLLGGLGTIRLRLHQNTREPIEKAKGFCCVMIGSSTRHTKTKIHCPEIDGCSDWQIHHNIATYFNHVSKMLEELEENRREILKQITADKKEREEHIAWLEDYDNKNKKVRGRPSTNPLSKTYRPENDK